MSSDYAAALAWAVVLLAIVAVVVTLAFSKGGGGRGGPGPGAAGAVYDLLNQDKRNAIELIVEDKRARAIPKTPRESPRVEPDNVKCQMLKCQRDILGILHLAFVIDHGHH